MYLPGHRTEAATWSGEKRRESVVLKCSKEAEQFTLRREELLIILHRGREVQLWEKLIACVPTETQNYGEDKTPHQQCL